MRDSGFEFRSTDTYSIIDVKLRIHFPRLFDWMSESEPDDAITSSWLICMKPPYSRKSLIVYSDDQSLPSGFDIITACQLVKSKAGVQDRVLYLGMPLLVTELGSMAKAVTGRAWPQVIPVPLWFVNAQLVGNHLGDKYRSRRYYR